MAFGIFEQWPARLPSFIARWVPQVLAVAFVVPWTVLAIYLANTGADQPPFWRNELRMNGFLLTTMTGLLVAPWTAVTCTDSGRCSYAADQSPMIRSARRRSDSGSVRPIARAVVALMVKRKIDGCSTGRSCGLAPLRIRATYRPIPV